MSNVDHVQVLQSRTEWRVITVSQFLCNLSGNDSAHLRHRSRRLSYGWAALRGKYKLLIQHRHTLGWKSTVRFAAQLWLRREYVGAGARATQPDKQDIIRIYWILLTQVSGAQCYWCFHFCSQPLSWGLDK